MRIAYILNYDQIDHPKRPRAGSESSGNRHAAYPGYPPFSHGSMGMELLNSGFDVLPVANSNAILELNCLGGCSEESPVNTESPYYGPPSTSPSEILSLADLEPDSNAHHDPTIPSPQGSVPGGVSPLISPRFTGGPLNTGSPCYGPPGSSFSTCSSLPDYESDSSIHHEPTTSTPQEFVPEGASPSFSPRLTEGQLSEECQLKLSRPVPVTAVPVFWGFGFSKASGASGSDQADGTDSNGSQGHDFLRSRLVGYSMPSPDPAKLAGESQARPVAPASFNTERPQRICTNRKMTRYEDGEVLRYGAGESYRPFNNGNRDRERSPPPRRARSPLRPRSPIRDRDRDLRARTPPIISDSYVPNRSPRRRSRSPDRYRGPDRARDMGGESWRRRDNSRARIRSPVRRISPRRSPRRSPGRFSPGPRRDDRFDRARSPRRDFDIRDR